MGLSLNYLLLIQKNLVNSAKNQSYFKYILYTLLKEHTNTKNKLQLFQAIKSKMPFKSIFLRFDFYSEVSFK